MLKTTAVLLQELNGYSDPYGKIARMVRSGELIHLKRDLYLTKRTELNTLSFAMCSPSYVSFESALGYYHMIPEGVLNCTCATTGRKYNKEYHTSIGNFYYRNMPEDIFSCGVLHMEDSGIGWLLATKEKTVYDLLYRADQMRSRKDVWHFLFDDMRLYEDEFDDFDWDEFRSYTAVRCKSNHVLFLKMEEQIREQLCRQHDPAV